MIKVKLEIKYTRYVFGNIEVKNFTKIVTNRILFNMVSI